MTDIPHLTWPFRFAAQPDGTTAAVVAEQNSIDDYTTQVAVIVSCPIDFRDELPEFGITPLAFQLGDLQVGPMRTQVEKWLPPAVDLDAQELVDAVNPVLRTLQLAPVPAR